MNRQLPQLIWLPIRMRFRTAIAARHPGLYDSVPALRGLATQLETARGAVETSYTILRDEGYLQMRVPPGLGAHPDAFPRLGLGCIRAWALRSHQMTPCRTL
ncbi:hypothetical protein NQV17_36600, partial [Burkholderia sp. SCN-KJ]|nr:hypothetical protein [Burkholderia sp. SCN-KJ]